MDSDALKKKVLANYQSSNQTLKYITEQIMFPLVFHYGYLETRDLSMDFLTDGNDGD